MRKTLVIILPFILLFLMSCETSSTPQPNDTPIDKTIPVEGETPKPAIKRDCPNGGKILEGNKLVLNDKALIAYIVADSTTNDAEFGESHRVLAIYNADNCEEVERLTLPLNTTPDYAYYLAKVNYNNAGNILGIRGFDKVFCYDLDNKKLLSPLQPSYLSERYGEDAQSGMILRAEVWENFLIGFAKDEGTFAFDLSDKSAIKKIMPIAEYEVNETEFASLFAFPMVDGGWQLVLPQFDYEKSEFSINPILAEPTDVETNIAKNVKNNRFLVLREKNETKGAIAIDMKEYKKVDLPETMKGKTTKQILSWMKEGK